jgi:hypothetical protein
VGFVAGALPPRPHKELSLLDIVQKSKSFWRSLFEKRGQKELDHAKYERPTLTSADLLFYWLNDQ